MGVETVCLKTGGSVQARPKNSKLRCEEHGNDP